MYNNVLIIAALCIATMHAKQGKNAILEEEKQHKRRLHRCFSHQIRPKK